MAAGDRKGRSGWLRGAVWLLSAALLVGVGMAGMGKLLDLGTWAGRFQERWGLPGWLAGVVGAVELLGSLTLLVPRVAAYGALALAVVMGGAVGTHLLNGELSQWPPPAVLGAIAVAVLLLRRRDAVGPLGAGR